MNKKLVPCLLFAALNLLLIMQVNCDRSRWLKNLPDEKKINELSFIGTHDSAAHNLIYMPVAWTQNMTITEQLEAGIRVFNIRVRLFKNDVFAIHYDSILMRFMFEDVIDQIKDFLASNPKEFVIMFIQKWNRATTTMNECQILESKYIDNYPDLFVKNWTVSDTIGQHRGKILLAKGNGGFEGCTTRLPCEEQNNWDLSVNYYNQYDKWDDIIRLQDKMFSNGQYQCYINYLSASDGQFGLMPSEICCAEDGMNYLMLDDFRNPKNKLYIVMADFPFTELIEKIVDSNSE